MQRLEEGANDDTQKRNTQMPTFKMPTFNPILPAGQTQRKHRDIKSPIMSGQPGTGPVARPATSRKPKAITDRPVKLPGKGKGPLDGTASTAPDRTNAIATPSTAIGRTMPVTRPAKAPVSASFSALLGYPGSKKKGK